jgi:hypothetical protein
MSPTSLTPAIETADVCDERDKGSGGNKKPPRGQAQNSSEGEGLALAKMYEDAG